MKSMIIFELPENFKPDFTGDGVDFEPLVFKPCGKIQASSVGFDKNVFGSYVEKLSGGVHLLNIRTQKKTPKKSHIDAIVEEKVALIKRTNGGRPNRNELQNIKDDALAEVLAITFPDTPVDVKVLMQDNLVFIETTSDTKAVDYFDLIGKALGENLPYAPTEVRGVDVKFNSFVTSGIEDPFVIGNATKLLDEEGRVTTITKGTVSGSVAKDLVDKGAVVESLELEFDSCITFKVNPALTFSGIKFSSDMMSDVEDDEEGTTLLQAREIIRMFKSLRGILV